MTSKEIKIIEQAQAILEKEKDSRAKDFALDNDIKLDLSHVVQYGAYSMGALIALSKMKEELTKNLPKKKESKVYFDAFLNLITTNKRAAMLWLEGAEIRYRNHVRDKNDKLIGCEAYFTERRTINLEIPLFTTN